MSNKEVKVISETLGGGPQGVGDPDDKSLRTVEEQVLIPKIMRERIRHEKCADLANVFAQCAEKYGFFVVTHCRKENRIMQECMHSWFTNKEFRAECTEEYLKRRTEYRMTGVGEKMKKMQQIVT